MNEWFHNTHSPITELFDPLFLEKKVKVFIKRDDLLHPLISGNKFRKLKHNLLQSNKNQTLLTFGGAYSNHLYSFAAACKIFNRKGIVIVRGDGMDENNPTLRFAKSCNIELHFISREAYRLKENTAFIQSLQKQFGDFFLIPEGGTNALGIKGCVELGDEIEEKNFTEIFCAVGSSGTITGICESFSNKNASTTIIGVPALKNASYLLEKIQDNLSATYNNLEFDNRFHFGGYAKTNQELFLFIIDFFEKHNILLDPVYTSKVAYTLYQKITNNEFKENSNILFIHTGGIQGWMGMYEKFRKTIDNNLIPQNFLRYLEEIAKQ